MEFNFFMPVRIVAGDNCVKKNAHLFAAFGRRALVVTGKSSACNGALEDVVWAFNQNGQQYEVYDAVPQNPTVACVEEGARLARGMRADFVVAIGGGSPMDAAKAVAMLARQGSEGSIFTREISADVLPMIHIPTTAGTGSEVTPYAILNNDEKQTKTSISAPSLFPKIAFLDAKYTAGLPLPVTVNTAVDAVSHAVEGMLSVRAGELSDAVARESLGHLFSAYGALRGGELTHADRCELLYGAALAGVVIANTGTTPVHGMGYCLTYFHGVPHGRANGLLLPAFLRVCARKDPARTARVFAALGMDADAFADKLAALLGPRECYADATLHDYARRAAANKNIKNCAVPMEEADLYEVFKASVGA